MRATTAVVRFRGTLSTPTEPVASRLAVVEFPPSLRTLLVRRSLIAGDVTPYRCQIPYMIYVIFYVKTDAGVRLDTTTWPRLAMAYRRVCHYFRAAPMTSIDDALWRTPFPYQHLQGQICFGYDETMLEKLLSAHRNLRDLIQTVVESFWGTSFGSDRLEGPLLRSIPLWAEKSKDPRFLGSFDWEVQCSNAYYRDFNLTTLVRHTDPKATIRGRFNPGNRR